jgi:hypothetical protein
MKSVYSRNVFINCPFDEFYSSIFSFISDIAGQDIQAHKNEDSEAIKVVRNWLRSTSARTKIPGGSEILRRYNLFKLELSRLCGGLKLNVDEMIFNDYTNLVSIWLKENPPNFPMVLYLNFSIDTCQRISSAVIQYLALEIVCYKFEFLSF